MLWRAFTGRQQPHPEIHFYRPVMRICFFFVHPSKFHLFRHSINRLRAEGHEVDVTIVTKDVLEDLVQAEKWDYTNIYPEGRRGPLPRIVAFPFHALRTTWRLWRYTSRKQYDLFIPDDMLAVVGKVRGVPVLMLLDDDIGYIPEIALLCACATKILSPEVTDLGRFGSKKISYRGCHELAYLHPNYFTPQPEVVREFNPRGEPYVLMRLVSLTASHDRGKKGITDSQVARLIEVASSYGKVFISSERPLPAQFEPYRIRIAPQNIAHALSGAALFVGDSQTMTTEAAILGTPSLRFNDFVGKVRSLDHLEREYGLTFGFRTDNFEGLVAKMSEILASGAAAKKLWQERRARFLRETVDMNEVLVSTIYGMVGQDRPGSPMPLAATGTVSSRLG